MSSSPFSTNSVSPRSVLTRQVDGGNGHAGKRSPDLHFGLGAQSAAVKVDIKWRDNYGNLRQETHQLNPGWHTLTLASENRLVLRQTARIPHDP